MALQTGRGRRRWGTVFGVVAGSAVAWIAAGVAPFTGRAYVVLAAVVAVTCVWSARPGGLLRLRPSGTRTEQGDERDGPGSGRERVVGPALEPAPEPNRTSEGRPATRDVVPWVVLAAAAVVLETVGLVLGGRSATVPTLSTTVDHLMAFRGSRFALFLLWLGAWWVPSVRAGRRASSTPGGLR